MEIIILIFLVATILVRFMIGGRLFASAKQNNLPNLSWLAWYFVANAFNVLFAPHPDNPLGNQPYTVALFILPVLVAQAFLILFNQNTFYKDKQSPTVWFWAVFAVTSLVTIYGVAASPSSAEQSPWAAAYIASQVLIWSWHSFAAYRAWLGIANERTVEDWIKSRYLLIVAYPVVFVIGSLASAVRIVVGGGAAVTQLVTIMTAVTLFTQFISVVMQYLVWVMPESFSMWLNRNYQMRLDEYSEHQSRAILQLIGGAIARDAEITQMAALRAVRHVIGKIVNAENPEALEKHISRMGYREWMTVLQSPELPRQISLVSAVKDVGTVVEHAIKTLVENQSLFTIESK
jgi:hypothetical protein